MIELATQIAATPKGAIRPALPATGEASSFALALGILAAPTKLLATPQPDATLPLATALERQAVAATGKELPLAAIVEGEAEDKDVAATPESDTEEAPEVDPALIGFAWFALPQPPVPTPVVPNGTPTAAAPQPGIAAVAPSTTAIDGIVLPDMVAQPPRPLTADEARALRLPEAPQAAPQPTLETAALDVPTPSAEPKPVTEQATQVATTQARVATNAYPIAAPARPVLTQLLAEPLAQPAAQVFAAAIAAAVEPAAPRRTASVFEALTPLASAPATITAQAVAPTPDAQQGALDMTRHEWMAKMVDHIEALRDAAPVRETRISLSPEALGKVDVSIRQEGERVHVHFATETQAARQIIADAQPRLTELAEARGVRIAHASVESGASGQGSPQGQQRPNAEPSQPSRPPSASASAREDEPATDDRIA